MNFKSKIIKMMKKLKASVHYLPLITEALHSEHGPQQYGIRLQNIPKLKVTICMGGKKALPIIQLLFPSLSSLALCHTVY